MRRVVFAYVVLAACTTFGSSDDPPPPPSGDGGAGTDGGAVVAATSEVGISSIAVDSTDVYWSTSGPTGGRVATCAKSGCTGAPRIIADNQNQASHVTLTSDRVVWLADDIVRSAPKSGGAVFETTKGKYEAPPTGFALIGDDAFVVDGRYVRLCKDAFATLCDATVIGATALSTLPILDILRSGSEILVWSAEGLRRHSVGAQTSSVFHVEPDGVATAGVESQIFYVTSNGVLRAIELSGVPDGGTPREVTSGLPKISLLVVDVNDIFMVAESDGKILRVPRSGGAFAEMRTGLSRPRALALDVNDVWIGVAGTGEILRIPK